MLVVERGGRDEKVVRSNKLACGFQCCPDLGVLTGNGEIEVDGLDLGQDQFDEPSTSLLPCRRFSALDAVEEFGGGNGCDAEGL